MAVTLHHGNAVEWARQYSGEPFHALICDPPYHLTSIVKRFGSGNSAPAQFGKDGAFSRASAGFMGKQWDGGDVAFDPATWDAFKSIMYPGAFGMAFASSRGWHRLAVAIEDAGFVIHPSMFGWTYGSGFPKATRLNHGHPKTETFAGHRYGLQALKPALEPIIVFQKPYSGRPIDNITETGAGVLNVDGGRIASSANDVNARKHKTIQGKAPDGPVWNDETCGLVGSGEGWTGSQGRWPANFYLGDTEAARRLDEQSGTLKGDAPNRKPRFEREMTSKGYKGGGLGQRRALDHEPTGEFGRGYSDFGGASRFFFRVSEQIDDADPVRYVAKASRRERDAGLDEWPKKFIPFLEGDTRPIHNGADQSLTGDRSKTFARNPHPTVKPLALTKYLATLLLPPAEYAPRRLFVPFAGVASECIGAMQAGWENVVGVELTEEYLPIARARVEYWQKQGVQAELLT